MWTAIGNLVVVLLPRLIRLAERKSNKPSDGAQKKATVKEVILAAVEGVEGIVGRDIFNNAEVSRAYDAVNDAIVAFQNVVARTAAKKAPVDAVPGAPG